MCAAVPSYAFGVEPKWLEPTVHAVPVVGTLDSPIRVLQLSDLHVSSFVPFSLIDRSVHMGLAHKPDIAVITGDFITNHQAFDMREYTRILKKLTARVPTYATLGNHDGGPWAAAKIGGFPDTKLVRQLLANSGIALLHNRSELLRLNGQQLRLTGVGDLWNEEVDGAAAFADVRPGTGTVSVLLAHNPDTKDLVPNYPWDVMLSGHTHGGQVLVPIVGTRFVAVKDKRFVSGLHRWNNRFIYTTRGVGNLAGVRLNCRPEVSVLDLTPSA